VGKTRRKPGRWSTRSPICIRITSRSRVDDNLGTTKKITPDVYRAVIEEAHKRSLRLFVHYFYLDDAKDLVRSGADMLAHSVRDKDVDAEFIKLIKERGIPYRPTLTRELSTFVTGYSILFTDPFFLREAGPKVIAQLKEPARQQAMRDNKSAQGSGGATHGQTQSGKSSPTRASPSSWAPIPAPPPPGSRATSSIWKCR
jgi:hypothetical protein